MRNHPNLPGVLIVVLSLAIGLVITMNWTPFTDTPEPGRARSGAPTFAQNTPDGDQGQLATTKGVVPAFWRVQELSDKIGRYMVRNRYCPTGQRPVNLVPVTNAGGGYVLLPAGFHSDIYLDIDHVETEQDKQISRHYREPWNRTTVHVLVHEWVHVCTEVLRGAESELVVGSGNVVGGINVEGLADAVALDITRRLCWLQEFGCIGKIGLSYPAAAKDIRIETTRGTPGVNSGLAVSRRRAMVRGWRSQ